MKRGLATAPGKLFLLGEYAVTDGGPAIVLAIHHGVRCDVEPGPLRVVTPDGDDRFVRDALMGAPAATYRFSELDPIDLGGAKPGFGGSASACVAACVAAGRPATDAFEFHRKAQGGGSGADVAASIRGGCILFERGRTMDHPRYIPVVVWTGQSSSTQPMVDRYGHWARADIHHSAFVAASRRHCYTFAEDPMNAFRAQGDLLVEMTTRAQLPYLTDAHVAVRAFAAEAGGAAKPSGAGGGDCAVAFFAKTTQEEQFRQRCSDNGLRLLDVRVGDPASYHATEATDA